MPRCAGCHREGCSRAHTPCECWCHIEKPKIQIDLSDPETRATFESAKQAKREVAKWPAWKRGQAANPTCSVHRRYQAVRKPRTTCEACWRMYFATRSE